MKNLTFNELDKYIFIYKNLIPNAKEIVKLLKESETNPDSSFLFKDWQSWSVFGSYVYSIENRLQPTDLNFKNERYVLEENVLSTIENAFYNATNHFLEYHGSKAGEDWVRMGPSFSKYTHDNPIIHQDETLEMVYHTDYKPLEAESPGNKFALTCTMYLNDDYAGGGLSFITGEKEVIDYKPEEGDVLVFPSGHPELFADKGKYLHGVKKIHNIDKYLIRCFYQIPFEGTKEWHENLNKFGAEVWEKMEKERISSGKRYHDFDKRSSNANLLKTEYPVIEVANGN
jgi:hypothetical protein